MKLYYTPGACSQAPHIALRELGLSFDTVKVDLATHTLPDGSDFRAINPKGYVPLLELDDGTRLSEASVILQYVADQKPGTIAPVFGTLARWKLMEWIAFISTEVHKGAVESEDAGRGSRLDRAGTRQSLHVDREDFGRAAVPDGP